MDARDRSSVRTRTAAAPPPERERPEPAATPKRERRDYAYLGLLAFTAVVFFRPQDVFPPIGVLHLAELTATVGLVAMVNGRLARQQPLLPFSRDVMGIIAFASIMAALIPFSIWPGGSLALLTELYLKVVLIFILMAGTLTTAARLERFVWLIIIASGYIGFRGVFDYARGINMVENGRLAGAVGGVFNNPNDLALNMVAFLSPALLISARRGRASWRVVAAVASVLMAVTVIFTKSRGGFLGLGAMLLVLLVQGGKVRRGFGAVIIVAALASLPLMPASFWSRMASISDDTPDETGSREARRTVMREAFHVFLERPLTGVGPGEFKDYNPQWRRERYREAHNVWLQVASETGIAGVLVFGYLVIRAFSAAFSTSRSWARSRNNSREMSIAGLYSTAMTASLTGWFVCSMFASVAYTWTFYYVFGIAMGARVVAARARASQPGSAMARAGSSAALQTPSAL